jgi:hypothetical protein
VIGLWLTDLFVILPGAAGAAIAFALSKGDAVRPRMLVLGALVGIAVGVSVGIFLFRF